MRGAQELRMLVYFILTKKFDCETVPQKPAYTQACNRQQMRMFINGPDRQTI